MGGKGIGPHDLGALVVGPSLLVSVNRLVRIAVAVELIGGCSGCGSFPPGTIFAPIFVDQLSLS